MRLCKVDLKDGVYPAIWGGWNLNVGNKIYETEIGIRTPRMEIIITVREGIAYDTAKIQTRSRIPL